MYELTILIGDRSIVIPTRVERNVGAPVEVTLVCEGVTTVVNGKVTTCEEV